MNVPRLFLTGEPGCGKTTAIRKIFETLTSRGIKAEGMISGEIRKSGARVGFTLEDLVTKESGILAHVDLKNGPSVGKYHVNLRDIERVGVSAINHAIMDATVIIVDELGPMELHSKLFLEVVEKALATPKAFVGTLHRRATHPLVTSIRSNPTHEIIELTHQNREHIPQEIVERLINYA